MAISDLASVATIENEMPVEDRWSAKTVYQQLEETAAKFGNKPAISFQLLGGAADPNLTLNWNETKDRITQAANLFRSLGVGPKDVVAYLLPTTHETAITMMGGMTAGIVAPINPTLDADQISSLLRETGAKVLVTLKLSKKIRYLKI